MRTKKHVYTRGLIWLPVISVALLSGCNSGHSPNSDVAETTKFGVTDTSPADNGVAETLGDVVDLYDDRLNLALSNDQKGDLVEYLKSL